LIFVSTDVHRAADEAQPGFMDECRRLQRLARGFVGHPVRGQPAQFFVHQRQQFVRRFGIAVLDGIEDARHLAHAF
jgi:hypothetical protein